MRARSSTASNTAAAIAKTPGSPPETTATAAAFCRKRQRMAGAVDLDAVVAGMGALVRAEAQAARHRAP